MKAHLDHPLKRLAFAVLILSSLLLIGLLTLPTPFYIGSNATNWNDVEPGQSVDRTITRVKTECASNALGGGHAFAKDFWIIESIEDEYSRMIGLNDGTFEIATTIDYTEQDLQRIKKQLSGTKKSCVDELCVERLTLKAFNSIVSACGHNVGQHREVKLGGIDWLILEHFHDRSPWTFISLVLILISLLTGVLYETTLGRLLRWIRVLPR